MDHVQRAVTRGLDRWLAKALVPLVEDPTPYSYWDHEKFRPAYKCYLTVFCRARSLQWTPIQVTVYGPEDHSYLPRELVTLVRVLGLSNGVVRCRVEMIHLEGWTFGFSDVKLTQSKKAALPKGITPWP